MELKFIQSNDVEGNHVFLLIVPYGIEMNSNQPRTVELSDF